MGVLRVGDMRWAIPLNKDERLIGYLWLLAHNIQGNLFIVLLVILVFWPFPTIPLYNHYTE